jgi:hypothetical protein
MLSEHVQDESCPVEHLGILANRFLQFTLVARRELIIEQHDIGRKLRDQLHQLTHLAGTNERRGVWAITALDKATHRLQPGTAGELRQLRH